MLFENLPYQKVEKMFSEGFVSFTERLFLDKLEELLGVVINRQSSFKYKSGCRTITYHVDGLVEKKELQIVIEFDGFYNHFSMAKKEKDEKRDAFLLENGVFIYRLQWFDYITDRDLYIRTVEKEAIEAAKVIALFNKLWAKKNRLPTKVG